MSIESGDKRIESFRSTKIGILGAQGTFGAALRERLARTKKGVLDMEGTATRSDSAEIAARSDLIILAVKKEDADRLLDEIRIALRPEAHVISFIARYPLREIEERCERPVVRGMTDPWWNVSAACSGKGFAENHYWRIFWNLTQKPTIRYKDESSLENFTAALSFAFAILLKHQSGELPDADGFLQFIAPFLGVSKQELEHFLPQGDPKVLLTKIATPGGVTEKIFRQLATYSDITPRELFDSVSG